MSLIPCDGEAVRMRTFVLPQSVVSDGEIVGEIKPGLPISYSHDRLRWGTALKLFSWNLFKIL